MTTYARPVTSALRIRICSGVEVYPHCRYRCLFCRGECVGDELRVLCSRLGSPGGWGLLFFYIYLFFLFLSSGVNTPNGTGTAHVMSLVLYWSRTGHWRGGLLRRDIVAHP